MKERIYIAIDLKSFFASVECCERGLDPLDTNLVVADEQRTDKTICLAVTPSLKSYGISGRARLFEVRRRVCEMNALRRGRTFGKKFDGKSFRFSELQSHPSWELDFIIAPPRMSYYMQYSAKIYGVYMKYVSPEDIVVYSIDEVFMDVTRYLSASKLSAREFAMKMIQDVFEVTGITATAGIGTNLFLAKVAMDVVAKRMPADVNGVRIASLDEMQFRRMLWMHRPLTDFWRIGRGYARKLEANGMFTMGDIAMWSEKNEDILYRLFGKNAELLIDHAWGWEPCTIGDIKAYKSRSNSMGAGQVLSRPYEVYEAKIVLYEMADQLALDLVDKGVATDQLILNIGYDIENLSDPCRFESYGGSIKEDRYGRMVPETSHGSVRFKSHTASSQKIVEEAIGLFDRIVNKELLIRRLYLSANHVKREGEAIEERNKTPVQRDLFTDYALKRAHENSEREALERERRLQEAVLSVKKKFGKNAIFKGMSLEEGATAILRNERIGGHKA